MTALARYTIRAAAVRRRSPAAILRWVSEVMLRREEPDVWNPEELARAVATLRGRDPQAVADGLLAMAAPDPARAPRDDIAIVALRAAI